MKLQRIVILAFLFILSVALVLATNYFLDGLLAYLAPGTTITPEGDDLVSIALRVFFFIIDIITIIAIFKWLRR